jgi:phage terminase large subunit GpA-like protein
MAKSDYRNPDGISRVLRNASQFLRPPPELLPSEWAEKNIKIPLGNAIPGMLRFDNAPYQVEPLNMLADPSCTRVTLMWGAQTGKTLLINCAIGYYIAHEPVSQMMMQPSQGDLHTWLETKLNPMVDSNEVLQERIAKPRSREGVNNQAMKSYPGGFLMFAWAGSPRTMRGRSAPKIYCDEVDGYEFNAEGHPVNLLWQRAATFGDQRKLLVTSTPTIKGVSFVESSFDEGDRRRYHIPCPHCGDMIHLKWGQVLWDKDENGAHRPETAMYYCQSCGAGITDGQKRAALRHGKWIAEMPFRGHASYHLNELYSSFRKWGDIVQSFLEKKANNDIQSFVNVSLAETWEEIGEVADPVGMQAAAESYDRRSNMPEIVLVTAGADVQKDRIEVEVVGFSKGGTPWVIETVAFFGDPKLLLSKGKELDDYLNGTFCGMKIACTLIDSGYLTDFVYDFTKKRHSRRIFPSKGESGTRELVSTPKQTGAKRAMLVKIGVDPLKRTLFALLKNPGTQIHFSNSLPAEWFGQLSAEKMVSRKVKGYDKLEFVKVKDRNEAIDMTVGAMAAMHSLNPNWEKLGSHVEKKRSFEHDPEPIPEVESQLPPTPIEKRRLLRRKPARSFVTGWR